MGIGRRILGKFSSEWKLEIMADQKKEPAVMIFRKATEIEQLHLNLEGERGLVPSYPPLFPHLFNPPKLEYLATLKPTREVDRVDMEEELQELRLLRDTYVTIGAAAMVKDIDERIRFRERGLKLGIRRLTEEERKTLKEDLKGSIILSRQSVCRYLDGWKDFFREEISLGIPKIPNEMIPPIKETAEEIQKVGWASDWDLLILNRNRLFLALVLYMRDGDQTVAVLGDRMILTCEEKSRSEVGFK